jgi:UDP-galactopyranose mutase
MENKQLPEIIIGGAGLFGSICAQELAQAGFKVKVFEKRNHIGGNCYTETKDGIDIHTYGPHIFHTSNEIVWSYINRFTTFNNFRLSPIANYKGELYSLPFNMWTFQKMWGVTTPEEAIEVMKGFGSGTEEARLEKVVASARVVDPAPSITIFPDVVVCRVRSADVELTVSPVEVEVMR